MENLYLKIISIERVIFEEKVSEVSVPGELGPFTILPSHSPIISTLSEGYISFAPLTQAEGELANGLEMYTPDLEDAKSGVLQPRLRIKIKEGFIEMNEDIVTICITEENGDE